MIPTKENLTLMQLTLVCMPCNDGQTGSLDLSAASNAGRIGVCVEIKLPVAKFRYGKEARFGKYESNLVA